MSKSFVVSKKPAENSVAEDLLAAVKEMKANRIGRKITFEFVSPGVVRRTIETANSTKVVSENLHGPRWEVVALRKKLKMNPSEFAQTFHVNKRTLENWEQGRSEAKGAALQLIRLAAVDPSVVDKLKCLS